LYKQVEDTAKINQISGTTLTHELFDVDVNLHQGNQTERGFSYSDCRVTNYTVDTPAVAGKEESFFFWFALENTFEIECLGYQPKNPVYDTMFELDQPELINSKYWENTQRWSDEFRYIPRDKSN